MLLPGKKALLLAVAGVIAAAGLVAAGRLSVDTTPAHLAAAQSDQYFAGLTAGEAEGRREGRVLQEGTQLPANARRPVREAFNAGYTAGANDVFAGYDGGWSIGAPYLVTMAEGSGNVVYRIAMREPMQPDTNYYLCSSAQAICREPRH